MRNSNLTGWDSLSNKTLKKLKNVIAPKITHLFNAINKYKHFPTYFKLSKILPLLKHGKNSLLPDSFRPINNLPVLEKLWEEYVLMFLLPFIIEDEVIHPNHHGGLKYHSLDTLMTAVQIAQGTNFDNGFISVIISTDLSVAFDTVDHYLPCQKLAHYGIRGDFLETVKSYLGHRQQYVAIDGTKSEILDNPPCSTVQGSKMAGLLYNLYNGEIPELYKIIHSNQLSAITKRQFEK